MPDQTTKVSSEKYGKLTSVTLRIRLAVKTTHPQDLPIHLKSRDAFVYTSIPLFSFFLPRQEEMVPFSEDTRTRNSFYITSSTPANDNNNKHERAICISLILDFQRTKSRREDPVFVISGALCDKLFFLTLTYQDSMQFLSRPGASPGYCSRTPTGGVVINHSQRG